MPKVTTLAFVLAILSASCGGSGSPVSPGPSYPSVGGNYSGPVTFTFPEAQLTVNCQASTSVTQSGASVSIAPIVLTGQYCTGLTVPVGSMTIDTTGSFGTAISGTYNEPTCGTYTYSASGGFFGRELRMSMTATSATCLNMNISITLTR